MIHFLPVRLIIVYLVQSLPCNQTLSISNRNRAVNFACWWPMKILCPFRREMMNRATHANDSGRGEDSKPWVYGSCNSRGGWYRSIKKGKLLLSFGRVVIDWWSNNWNKSLTNHQSPSNLSFVRSNCQLISHLIVSFARKRVKIPSLVGQI